MLFDKQFQKTCGKVYSHIASTLKIALMSSSVSIIKPSCSYVLLSENKIICLNLMHGGYSRLLWLLSLGSYAAII